MIPLRDDIRTESRPVVTWVLIGVNLLIFLYEQSLGEELTEMVLQWGLVPLRLTTGARNDPLAWAPLVTSTFLHAGWMHVLGNMLFLYVFGDNVEDRLGKPWFLGFYLASGVLAGVTQYALDPLSRIPIVGASGAVAAVLGAYIVFFPKARVLTLIPIFIILRLMVLPAYLLLGVWFLLQFVSGSLEVLADSGAGGGVAWWAHVGGFAVGALVGLAVRTVSPATEPVRREYSLYGGRTLGRSPWDRRGTKE